MRYRGIIVAGFAALITGAGWMSMRAQDPVPGEPPAAPAELASGEIRAEIPVADPSCTFFGPDHDKFVNRRNPYRDAGLLTARVVSQLAAPRDVAAAANLTTGSSLPSAPGGSRTDSLEHPSGNTIDKYIFAALSEKGVAPAPPTTDFEFIRRVYLDLTGRIPAPTDVITFVSSADPDKRAKLIDTLIGSPNWVDKWTMWFGDLLKNNSRNTQIPRYMPGVLAFNNYIRTSLSNNKRWDQMARELISAQGSNSWTQGELNFAVGGFMGGGPIQDIFDAQIAATTETFLGISHLNCLLCHSGRGHLDALSLWGYYETRQDAWGMASFMSHTWTNRTPPPGAVNGNPYYWSLQDDLNVGRGQGLGAGYDFQNDYPLNTTTGNRPARGALTDPTNTAKNTPRVKPVYIFDGTSPAPGQNYREFLAQKMTSDFQFSRAMVNYLWEYFFGVGLVSPSNQMDPDRLDPDNPPSGCPLPASPCTLQASNPRLLNALAQDFVTSGYDIRALQREIVNSRAYQLSSRYEGTWDIANANLFGRKLVRRLWAEEIHDSIAMSSGVTPNYPGNYTYVPGDVRQWGPVSWAMKFPEPLNTPDNGGAVSQFLDAFLRGNRDDQERRGDGSISQALGLMNDNFVMSRVRSNAAGSLIQTVLKMTDNTQAVNTLYLTVLSRLPTAAELDAALTNLKTNRTQEMQSLLWSLYNSVSFTFNY
jgi:hypothetical protein